MPDRLFFSYSSDKISDEKWDKIFKKKICSMCYKEIFQGDFYVEMKVGMGVNLTICADCFPKAFSTNSSP